MKLIVKSTNITLTPAIRTYIDQKLNRDLERFVSRTDYPVSAWVEVGKTSRHHKKGIIFRAEVQIHLPGGKAIRAVSERQDLHIAIDKVKDELQGQLTRYKGRGEAMYKRGARKVKRSLTISKEAKRLRKGRVLDEGI